MKHLKTYENINVVDKLKKYQIWLYPTASFTTTMLYEILKLEIEATGIIKLHLKDLYFIKNSNEIAESDNFTYTKRFWSYDKLFNLIKYQSDDLEDCKEKLNLMINVNKYNL